MIVNEGSYGHLSEFQTHRAPLGDFESRGADQNFDVRTLLK
jgi:hypothetical protein